MKVPTHVELQKIMNAHRGDRQRLTIKRNAAPAMYLMYLLFMKKLAREADLLAFSQRRQVIRERDIKKAAKKVLNDFSLTEKIRKRNLQHMTSEGEDVEAGDSDASVKDEATILDEELSDIDED
ncbi:uncharacterized protein LOC143027013 [Oratosquilla oratoria]|uniref:uncharacterized protein LOC143027013 n=1 Tax=Oratosquilla oratoria TaxID=337810 RepID=UPI003F776203